MVACKISILYDNASYASHDNYRRAQEGPSISAPTGEAPPAPGLTRRPPKQSDQQEQQVSFLT